MLSRSILNLACQTAMAVAHEFRVVGDHYNAEVAMSFARKTSGLEITQMPRATDKFGNLHFAPTLNAARESAIATNSTY